MFTLAIETSGNAGSIALLEDLETLAEVELTASGRRHARTLVPEIGQLLRQHGLTPQQINLLAVSLGPGSFTGLRVGIVCAKTFAYAVGCPLIGVDTFLAVAVSQQETERVWVIDDALRGDVCAGEYVLQNGRWETCLVPQLVSAESWREQLDPAVPVTGPGVARFSDLLAHHRLINAAHRTPRAEFVARLGVELFQTGRTDDPWTLEPFYMRRSAAEEKADLAGGKGVRE